MKIPRNLQFDLCCIGSTPIFKVFPRVFWFPFGWNNIELDLFTFNASLLALNLFVRSSISEFIFVYKSFMQFDEKNTVTVVSSANDINLECVNQFAMSFT